MVLEQTVSSCTFTSVESLGKSVRDHLDVNLDCNSPHNSCLYKTLYGFSRCLKSSVFARQDGYASIFSLPYITSENRASLLLPYLMLKFLRAIGQTAATLIGIESRDPLQLCFNRHFNAQINTHLSLPQAFTESAKDVFDLVILSVVQCVSKHNYSSKNL